MSLPTESLSAADVPNGVAGPSAWDQLADEPTASYIRFLIFRNLGPHRSVRLAATLSAEAAVESVTGKKPKKNEVKVSVRTWWDDSSKYNWKHRAKRWDLYRLNDAPERVHAAIGELMIRIANEATKSFDTGVTPKPLRDALMAFKELCPHVPSLSGGQADTLRADEAAADEHAAESAARAG